MVDSSEASNSVNLAYEAETNYCFWPQRDTDYIKVVLSYVSAEYIATQAANDGTATQQPAPPAEPEETGTDESGTDEAVETQPTLVITDIGQTEKDSDTIIKVATNQDVTIGAAVRIDKLSVSGCDQAAFADDDLLHGDAAIENGSFYITVTSEDHGQEFCFQVQAGDEIAYKVSGAVDLPPPETDEEDEQDEEDGSDGEREEEKDEEEDEAGTEDEDEKDEAEQGEAEGVTVVDDEGDNSTLFFIIIIAAIGVGVMAVFAIIIGISNGGRSKKKF